MINESLSLLAILAGILCIGLLWLTLRSGGLGLEDSWDFSITNQAVVKVVKHTLKDDSMLSLDTLGDALQSNNLRLVVIEGGTEVYANGEVQEIDGQLLHAVEELEEETVLVSAGKRSIGVSEIDIGSRTYQIYVYGTQTGEIPTGTKLIFCLTVLILLCAVLAAIWGTNRFLIRFVFKKIEYPLTILTDGVAEIGNGNLNFRITYDGQDEFTPVCAAFNDMAARLKVSVEQSKKDEESRKELLAGISHDLRSPLTSIQAYVEGLLDDVAQTTEARQKYLLTIKTKAEDIDHMVTQLLQFSKLDMEEYPISLNPIHLNELITALVDETGAEYKSKGLEISVNISEPVTVLGDAEQLQRALTNIMDNSAKYKEKSIGHLNITLTTVDDMGMILLSDDGPGVPEDTLSKLFEVFYRTDLARSNPAGGSGLGLAISAKTVRRMGGTIYAENGVNGGLTINMTLLRGNKNAEDSDC